MSNFWSAADFEVKRSFRWRVLLGTEVTGYQPYFAKKVNKPSFSIGETTHNYLNHKFYYPGQITWNDVTLTLVDPVGTSVDQSKSLMHILGTAGYVFPDVSTTDGVQTISKGKSTKGLGLVKIQQLKAEQGGGPGKGSSSGVAETWTLFNPWIKEVKFGDLDYSSEDMVVVDVTFKYDFAKHTQGT